MVGHLWNAFRYFFIVIFMCAVEICIYWLIFCHVGDENKNFCKTFKSSSSSICIALFQSIQLPFLPFVCMRGTLSFYDSICITNIFILPDWMIWGGGHIVFSMVCLFVCLSVVNFNLRYKLWTIRDRDFISDLHTPLIMSFQMKPMSMALWPWLRPLSLK